MERLAEESGLSYIGGFAAFMGVHVEGCHGHVAASRRWLERLDERTDPARWYDRATYCCSATWFSVFERDPRLALVHGAEGIALIADGVANSAIQWRLPLAMVHAARGDRDETRRLLDELAGFERRHGLHYWRPLFEAVEAILALRTADEAALRRALAELLRSTAANDETYLWFLRAYLPEIFAAAFARDIDVVEARRLVRLYGLPSPDAGTDVGADAWPWQVRVRVLGRFALELDGEPVVFKGKVPRKPLALLGALVCFGGRDVPLARLADALWPDQDGDDALRALNTALFRLRALLGRGDALVVADGRISIDRTLMWTDLHAFEAACAAADRGDVSALHRAQALYRGPLLDGEDDAVWAIDARERLHRRSQRVFALEGTSVPN